MKKLFFRALVTCCSLMLLVACEHRELSDPNTGHYLRVYLNEEIKNVTCGFYNENLKRPEYNRPSVLRIVLADPESGRIVSERYLRNQGQDERGHYIDGYIGAEAGTYNLLIYSFGSATTLIRNEQDYYNMQAYTDNVNERVLQYLPIFRQEINESSIVYEPEHLFHDVGEPIIIPKSNKVDTLRNETGDYFTAHSVVLSYYLQIRVKGIEWVSSAVSLLSGMAEATVLHEHHRMVDTRPVNLFFDMNYTNWQRTGEGGSTATLYATFNTFGKLPDKSTVYTMNFEFIKTDGSSQVEKLDITPMFDTPVVKNQQWILLEHEIVITPPPGSDSPGGMTPGVDEWGEIHTEIEL